MAEIVLGIGTSHGPMLSTPPDKWGARVPADKSADSHPFRGGQHSFDALAALRVSENLADQITQSVWESRYAQCQTGIETLMGIYRDAKPDVAVIVGNDQLEMFTMDTFPAFTVYWGETIENNPFTEAQKELLPPGIAVAESGHHPPAPTTYPGLPDLGEHLIRAVTADGFDVAQSNRLPDHMPKASGIPHAYGFVYRQIMQDTAIPSVPVVLNTFYPPNQPTVARCYDFGRAIGRAIASWESDKTVAVIASGGLTHFVIDEELDRTVIQAMQDNDEELMKSIPEDRFQSGTSEIKNWITAGAALAQSGLGMNLVDYVPCYRSEAGTGNAMCFAYWR